MAIRSITKYLTPRNGNSQSSQSDQNKETNGRLARQARYLAEQYCSGFQLHDRRQQQDAVEAFYAVDRGQFKQVSDEDAYEAAVAYVDALWAKDEIEKRHIQNGQINQQSIRDADYTSVWEPLARRSEIVGMSAEYAYETTAAWHKHKMGEDYDYWTPFLRAQTIELQVALQNPAYPDKPRGGQSGAGPLATRYAVGVELHDMHTTSAWEEAIRVMTPYYQQILEAHK